MSANRSQRSKKVDATIDLILEDPMIERDWKILNNLGRTVRSKLAKPLAIPPEGKHPSLYRRYRGAGFPLLATNGGKLRPWGKLTPWMKTQIGSMCLQLTSSKVFTITLHEHLADELRARDTDLKAYLRDRLARCLRAEFGCVPWFQFVIEDRSRSGKSRVKVTCPRRVDRFEC